MIVWTKVHVLAWAVLVLCVLLFISSTVVLWAAYDVTIASALTISFHYLIGQGGDVAQERLGNMMALLEVTSFFGWLFLPAVAGLFLGLWADKEDARRKASDNLRRAQLRAFFQHHGLNSEGSNEAVEIILGERL